MPNPAPARAMPNPARTHAVPNPARFRAVALLLPALFACTLLSGCGGGWGVAVSSLFDRVFMPQETVWAASPEPDAFTESYADATGAGTNYVYRVQAATADGSPVEVTLISYGGKTSGEGWLQIEAHGGSGVRYRTIDEHDVPLAAHEALAAPSSASQRR